MLCEWVGADGWVEMCQQVKVYCQVCQPKFNPETHSVEGEKQLPKDVL